MTKNGNNDTSGWRRAFSSFCEHFPYFPWIVVENCDTIIQISLMEKHYCSEIVSIIVGLKAESHVTDFTIFPHIAVKTGKTNFRHLDTLHLVNKFASTNIARRKHYKRHFRAYNQYLLMSWISWSTILNFEPSSNRMTSDRPYALRAFGKLLWPPVLLFFARSVMINLWQQSSTWQPILCGRSIHVSTFRVSGGK